MATVITKQEFLLLSASINYQLAGDPVNWRAVLALLAGDVELVHDDVHVRVLDYLNQAYAGSKRRLGPMAVLHPIRNSGLLCRAMGQGFEADLLTAMLHDKLEDINPSLHEVDVWARLEADWHQLLHDMPAAWQMERRLRLLTRQRGDTYYSYLGRVLDAVHEVPALVRIKLADRLDNTLDLGIDIMTELSGIDSFELIFDILFTSSTVGTGRRYRHPIPRKMNGAQRLYQLFKNVIFLSLLRRKGLDAIDVPAQRLFESLVRAGLDEAKSILAHLFIFHLPDKAIQRALLLEAMEYCQGGAIETVTLPGALHPLDGLFSQRFDHREKQSRQVKLAELYQDKHLMAMAAVAFASIFSNFLNDAGFLVRGIDESGIHLP